MGTTDGPGSFRSLLQRYRLAAGLSQEELAERAGLSRRGISDLERGQRRAPHPATVRRLAEALGLAEANRITLQTAARRPADEDTVVTPNAAAGLPTGLVTFLLTDIEGSTRLWEQDREGMRAALGRHDALIEGLVAEHGGVVVRPRGEGDSRFAVFAQASAAVAAAAAIQVALHQEAWPLPEPLRVRLALHTGEADLRDGDYYGTSVNRCARLRALAHGGQALISAVTAALVAEALPEGIELQDLGVHQLKDLDESERIWQVVQPGVPSHFPPLTALSETAVRTNLPRQLTTFVGREHELQELAQLLQHAPLLTLTGAGGVGKTRLALRLAETALADYADGVWLVELAPVIDPRVVSSAVAAAISVQEPPDRSVVEALREALRDRELLLVLDNCEHLIQSCAELAEALLRACRRVRILATSREPLRAAGETIWRVPSLSVPVLLDGRPVDQIGRSEAGRLFLERVQAARPDFVLTERSARAAANVCRRLDGIPLALELAAARARLLDVEQLASRLDDRFRLLTGGTRTAPPRQQTLRATVEWSYELLSEQERRLFERLAVFAGGWTLEAAEAVCSSDARESGDVLDLLGQLVDKSLVLADATAEGLVRYRMLETLRQYAQERLADSGSAESPSRRHAEYYLILAERAEPELTGAEQGLWLARLDQERDNLLAAMEWSLHNPESGAMALQLAAALQRFWSRRGRLVEGRAWLSRALAVDERQGGQPPPADRARALTGAAELARLEGDYATARSLLEESLGLARHLHDRQAIATCLNKLGFVALCEGDGVRAVALADESLALSRAQGDAHGMCVSLGVLGDVARRQGAHAQAAALYEEALSLARTLGNVWVIATIHAKLGAVASEQGRHELASRLLETSLQQLQDLGDRPGTAWVLGLLGRAARARDDLRQAKPRFHESLALFVELRATWGMADSLEGLARTTWEGGQAEAAVRLLGAAEALREASGLRRLSCETATHDRILATLRAHVGETVFAAAWEDGCAMSPEQAVVAARQLASE